jgi:ketosteroid isomerase-like protein
MAVLLVTLLSLPLLAADGVSASERESLLRVREDVWRSWFKNDIAKMRVYFPEETLAFDVGEDQWTDHQRVLAGSEEFVRNGGKLLRIEFPRTEIRRYGDVYILYSDYSYDAEQNGKPFTKAGRVTEVFVKKGKQWTNPGWHTSK